MMDSGRSGRISPVELLVIAATLVMAYATIVPPVVKSRRALKVELTALNLATVEDAIEILERRNEENPDFSRAQVTYDDICGVISDLGNKSLVWPPEVDLSTLDLLSTNGPSVIMTLPDNWVTVRVSDVSTPR